MGDILAKKVDKLNTELIKPTVVAHTNTTTQIMDAITQTMPIGRIYLDTAFKGGVGKSTSLIENGIYKFMNGNNVLLINGDPQNDIKVILPLTDEEMFESERYQFSQLIKDAILRSWLDTPVFPLEHSYIGVAAKELQHNLRAAKYGSDMIGDHCGSKIGFLTCNKELSSVISAFKSNPDDHDNVKYRAREKFDKYQQNDYPIIMVDSQTASEDNTVSEFVIDIMTGNDVIIVPISDVASAFSNLNYLDRLIADKFRNKRLIGGKIVDNPKIYFIITDWEVDVTRKQTAIFSLLNNKMKNLVQSGEAVNSLAAMLQALFPEGTIGAGSRVKRKGNHELFDGFRNMTPSHSNIVLPVYHELDKRVNNPLSKGLIVEWEDDKVVYLRKLIHELSIILGVNLSMSKNLR